MLVALIVWHGYIEPSGYNLKRPSSCQVLNINSAVSTSNGSVELIPNSNKYVTHSSVENGDPFIKRLSGVVQRSEPLSCRCDNISSISDLYCFSMDMPFTSRYFDFDLDVLSDKFMLQIIIHRISSFSWGKRLFNIVTHVAELGATVIMWINLENYRFRRVYFSPGLLSINLIADQLSSKAICETG